MAEIMHGLGGNDGQPDGQDPFTYCLRAISVIALPLMAVTTVLFISYQGSEIQLNVSVGAVYVRWGRTVCPSNSNLIYAGLAGGKRYADRGSGSNYLCLPVTPEYDGYDEAAQDTRAYVYTAEYETHEFPPLAYTDNHGVPCAVCRASNRGSLLTIPAKTTCPTGWSKEYRGYLMAERANGHYSTEFVCVDRDPELVQGTRDNLDGALFYPVEGRCSSGSLPCTPYINDAELTCVVCTK